MTDDVPRPPIPLTAMSLFTVDSSVGDGCVLRAMSRRLRVCQRLNNQYAAAVPRGVHLRCRRYHSLSRRDLQPVAGPVCAEYGVCAMYRRAVLQRHGAGSSHMVFAVRTN